VTQAEEVGIIGQRRFGALFLGESDLRDLLQLPESTIVMGVQGDFMRQGVMVFVADPSFEPVPEGVEPPMVFAGREIVRCSNNPDYVHLHVRWQL